jgi:hypothetical protein
MSQTTCGIAVFVFADWAVLYPELVGPNETPPGTGTTTVAQAANDFTLAGLYLSNSPGSVVQNLPLRTSLLYMLTAHIACLAARQAAEPNGNALVGRISDGTQGSVTVTTDVGVTTNSQAWFYQTQYGMSFWQATAAYRAGGRYKPGRVPNLGIYSFGNRQSYYGGFRR